MAMIPFFVDDVIDFFHRANIQNLQMNQGFVDGDETIIKLFTHLLAALAFLANSNSDRGR